MLLEGEFQQSLCMYQDCSYCLWQGQHLKELEISAWS